MSFEENVIPTLRRYLDEGETVALVMLVGVDGSSPRPLGSQIGVAQSGRAVGMITGGCAEKAIVAQAVQCMEQGENKIVRFGEGSPFLDVVLPCGSGIDVYFEVHNCSEVVETVLAQHAKRQPAFLAIDLSTLTSTISPTPFTDQAANLFIKTYEPDYQIYVFGEGENLLAFSSIAKAAGFLVRAVSPDEEALKHLKAIGVEGLHVHQSYDFASLVFDEHTAVVTLFHEHDWETSILVAALNSKAHYIGALGSRATHRQRLEQLAAAKPTRRKAETIRGPVGLKIGAQNPNEIAVSILAEITEARRAESP